jgi:hypothetical protein
MSSANQPTSFLEPFFVVFNITTQINEKLIPSSFSQWRAQFDHPVSDDDLTLYVLHGLGPEFREIAAPI